MDAAAAVPAVDFRRLTLGEVAKIEELSGLSLDAIGSDGAPKGKLLAAMAYVVSRRRGAPISWDEALGLTVDETNVLLGVAESSADVDDDESSADVDDDAGDGSGDDATAKNG